MTGPLAVNLDSFSVVIPSRGRANIITPTLALFPRDAVTVVVTEAEEALYRSALPGVAVAAHPASLHGMGQVRQWILDALPQDVIFMIDDDMYGLWSVVGHSPRRLRDPQQILGIVRQAARCAAEAGTPLFGFAQTMDVRNFKAQTPFGLGGFVNGSAMGIVGRDPKLRFDPALPTKQDVDYCLQVLLHYRMIWRDFRFSFGAGGVFNHAGGNASHRTMETVRENTARLKAKWGAAVEINHEVRKTFKRDKQGKLHRHTNISIRRLKGKTPKVDP